MATINYFIQSENNPAGIYVRLKEGRKIDAKAKTKYVINPKDWSKKKGLPNNSKDSVYKKLIEDLTSFKANLLAHYNNSVNKIPINSNWIKDFIDPTPIENEIPTKLLDYFDYYSSHKKSNLSNSTFQKINVYKGHLIKFSKSKKKDFFIQDVGLDFKLEFEDFCKLERYSINTITRTVKFLKSICLHARANGVPTHFQLDNIVAKYEKVSKIYLTPDEIIAIEKAELNNDYLINAKDWLIISCETGQRVSDFMRFKASMIRKEDKVPIIEFTQLKTGKKMAIPLSKKVVAILKKRKDSFPRKISDQRYNEFIKEVCKKAGLIESIKGSKSFTENEITRKENGTYEKWELVTSHIGRRTFATNNFGKIPTSLLSYMTGHSSEASFLNYVGKTETEKAKQLAKYF